jgi:hypothetical protein
MPFDPFFSSANKKHYVAINGVAELKAKVDSMSFPERIDWINQCKARGLNSVEGIVMHQRAFESRQKRRARIHARGQKNISKALEELKAGKRSKITIFQGFGTCPGARSKRQTHARGCK